LLAETGHLEQARVELDAALSLGVEFDDPALTSLALSFKGHLAWMVGNPHGVIALSGAARRDTRVFLAQHAFNAHREGQGFDSPQLHHIFHRALTRGFAALCSAAWVCRCECPLQGATFGFDFPKVSSSDARVVVAAHTRHLMR
jgi:hypothetical protein